MQRHPAEHAWGRRLWLLMASLIIILAVLVAVLRAWLPYVNRFTPDIEDWLATQTQISVDIGAIHAQWERAGLQLELHDVKLLEPSGRLKKMHFSDVRFRLDILRSLAHMRWYFNKVSIDGLYVNVNTAGVSTEEDTTSGDWLFNLLFRYFDAFAITDSTVDIDNLPIPAIHIAHLMWNNNGVDHSGSGAISLAGIDAPTITVTTNLHAEDGTPEHDHGQLYAEFDDIDSGRLLKQLDMSPWPLAADLSGGLWLDFSPRSISKAVLKLKPSALYLPQRTDVQPVPLSGGVLTWQRQEQGWRLQSSNLQFQGQAEPVQLALDHQPDAPLPWRIGIDRVPLQPLWPLLNYFADDAKGTLAQALAKTQGHGWLQHVSLAVDQQQKPTGQFDFADLGWHAWQHLPGLQAVSGHARLEPDQVNVELNVGQQSVQVGAGEFYEDFPLSQGKTKLTFSSLADRWRLQVLHASTASDELHTRLAATLDWPKNAQQSPELALYGEADLTDATKARRYFPLRAMGPPVANYLSAALLGGKADNAQILWRGPVMEFPYRQQQGIFQSRVPLRDGTFKFDPHWPAATQLAVDALFENNGLTVASHHGRLGDIQLDKLSGGIAAFHLQSWLDLSVVAQASAPQVTEVMQQSPLADSLGESLQISRASGQVAVDMGLHIPLGTFAAAKVTGTAHIHEGKGYIPGIKLTAANINGDVRFTNEIINTQELDATLLGNKVRVAIDSTSEPNHYQVVTRVKGNWPISALTDYIPEPLVTRFRGRTAWQADISSVFTPDSVDIAITGRSSLQGLSSSLPAPFTKSTKQSMPLVVRVNIDNAQTVRADWQLANIMKGWSKTDDAGDQLALAVGDIPATKSSSLPAGELRWSAKKMDLLPWVELYGQLPGGNASTPLINHIVLQFDTLQLENLQLHDVATSLHLNEQKWQADIHAKEVNGTASCEDPACTNLTVRLDDAKLAFADEALASDTDTAKGMHELPRIPAISFFCAQCQMNDLDLGQVELDIQPGNEGKSIDLVKGTFASKQGKLTLVSGSWSQQGKAQWSHFKGKLHLKDFGTWLGQLRHIKPPIDDSDLSADFDLRWAGAPWQMATRSTSGHVDWRLSQGSIPALSDHGARLLSLLSLDSLRRKLTLNFNDVYKQGLFYNDFSGFVRAEQGKLIISNTKMDGVAGEMTIDGYFDLNADRVDLDVIFHPDLTASLPVLAGLAVNPITGLYVLAASTVLKPVVKVVSQVRFKVTGPADDPQVEEVERKSRDVPLRPDPSAKPTVDGVQEKATDDKHQSDTNDQPW